MEAEHGSDGAAARADRDAAIAPSTRSVTGAVGWSFVMNISRLASTLGTAFLLASLLGPEAFGTVALALLFVTLVQMLIQQGMTPAIVQHQGLTLRHLDSAFWLSVGLSVCLAGFCFAVSPWWASANGAPEAKAVIWALSGTIVVKGLVVVQEGRLQRDMRFRELAIRTTVASVAGAIVGITWAVVHPSIWALVAQQLVSAVVGAVVIWGITEWRPRFAWRVADVRDLLSFAVKATLSSLGVFVNGRADALLIGLYFGATAIGLYQLAFRLVQSAIETAVYPLASVALADLSRCQHEPRAAADRYLSLVGAATSVGAPLMAIVFASAGAVMAVVGPEWAAAAPALRFLCVVGVVTVVGIINSPALQAAGRPGAQAALVWAGAVVSATTFAIAGALLTGSDTRSQVVGMAASRAVVYLVFLLPVSQAFLIARHVGVPWTRFVRVVAGPVGVSGLAAGAGVLVDRVCTAAGVVPIVRLLIVGTVTAIVVVPLVLVVAPEFRLVLRRLASRVPRSLAPDWAMRIINR